MAGRALTIAGSDSGGGAGIQADLRVFDFLGLYGTSVITALTAQNSVGVQAVFPTVPEQVAEQLRSITTDLPPVVTKTGMLPTMEIIDVVSESAASGALGKLVIDPVLAGTSGASLAEEGCAQRLIEKLIPHCHLMTPNLSEAAALTGMKIENGGDALEAARILVENGAGAVCVTGGHWSGEPIDYYFDGKEALELQGARILEGTDIHGTGCFFSAAAAGFIAQGNDRTQALLKAKRLIEDAIRNAFKPGEGMPIPWLRKPSL